MPEIADGTVEISAIAREAGHRTKIAVRTSVPGVNAKGACIGPMGQRVRAVMSELAARGLLFFYNGVNSYSAAMSSARQARAGIASATVTLDNDQTSAGLDARLTELENEAHKNGFAIGVASPFPVSLARIAEWAPSAELHGFRIVPVSALAKQPALSAEAAIRR